MADAIGKSLRQVKDDMAALEAKGLISHTRRQRNSNVYSFLWHAMFDVRRLHFNKTTLKCRIPLLKCTRRSS